MALTSYTLQYQINSTGGWNNIGTSVSIGPGTSSITLTNHNDSSLNASTSLVYRVLVIDAYQTFLSSSITGGNTTVAFQNLVFYGPSSSAPASSSDVRALGTRIFTSTALAGVFNLNTGSSNINFTVAMPVSRTLSQVLDLDALSANITSSYTVSTFNVQDAAGTNTSYHVDTMTIASPYATSHRHQITIT